MTTALSKDQAYALADAISEFDELAVAVSAFEIEKDAWAIEATCLSDPQLEQFQEVCRNTLGGTIHFEKQKLDPQIDWVKQSQEGLKPVHAGGFFIYGSHDADRIPPTAKSIRIDAAQAFGTGHHETTTGCLIAISNLMRHAQPHKCIDVGTGSGVLAIALAMILKKEIFATDIDPVAVDVALENAQINGVGRYIHPFAANGLDNPRIKRQAPFDLIVANILANPLIEIAPSMGRLAAKGGHIILSGITEKQATRVAATYRSHGFRLQGRLVRGDWATLTMAKS